MSRRFINCSACGGCHTGRGGQFCQFINTLPQTDVAGTHMASIEDDAVPDRDSAEYEPYLARKIEEEEVRLKQLKDKTRLAEMENQLASLRLQSSQLDQSSFTPKLLRSGFGALPPRTGVASAVLAASKPSDADSSPGLSSTLFGARSSFQPTIHRSKEEREVLSKLRALSHLPDAKVVEKITYRDFVSAMTKVAQIVCELGIDPANYIAHMSFISGKAALNLYATDAMIKYESAVTDRVISGFYPDWVAADPECVALHLGADATYAVRQGGGRWSRLGSGFSGNNRDFSDWPKDICWLFNNTTCYFPKCKKSHVCAKCKKTGHPMKECKSNDDSGAPNQTEVLSTKSAKETRKP